MSELIFRFAVWNQIFATNISYECFIINTVLVSFSFGPCLSYLFF